MPRSRPSRSIISYNGNLTINCTILRLMRPSPLSGTAAVPVASKSGHQIGLTRCEHKAPGVGQLYPICYSGKMRFVTRSA